MAQPLDTHTLLHPLKNMVEGVLQRSRRGRDILTFMLYSRGQIVASKLDIMLMCHVKLGEKNTKQ